MNGVHTIKRDAGAYERFKHNMARYKKYGAGNRMDLNIPSPKAEHVSDEEIFNSTTVKGLANLFHETEENWR